MYTFKTAWILNILNSQWPALELATYQVLLIKNTLWIISNNGCIWEKSQSVHGQSEQKRGEMYKVNISL